MKTYAMGMIFLHVCSNWSLVYKLLGNLSVTNFNFRNSANIMQWNHFNSVRIFNDLDRICGDV